MAYENIRDTIEGLEAGADLSANQFHIVKLDASGNVVLGAASTDVVLGVLQNKPLLGEAVCVAKGGVSKVLCGAVSVAVGDLVASNASGLAATAGGGDNAVGIALEEADPGQIFSVDLDRMKA